MSYSFGAVLGKLVGIALFALAFYGIKQGGWKRKAGIIYIILWLAALVLMVRFAILH